MSFKGFEVQYTVVKRTTLTNYNEHTFAEILKNPRRLCSNDPIFQIKSLQKKWYFKKQYPILHPASVPLEAQLKRQKAANDDHLITKDYSNALVVQWSEAVRISPDNQNYIKEIDTILIARMDHIKRLIKKGYQHFAILSSIRSTSMLKYQHKSKSEHQHNKGHVNYYNTKLRKICAKFELNYPHCSFKLINSNLLRKPLPNNKQQSPPDRSIRKQLISSLCTKKSKGSRARVKKYHKLRFKKVKPNLRKLRKARKKLNQHRFFALKETAERIAELKKTLKKSIIR